LPAFTTTLFLKKIEIEKQIQIAYTETGSGSKTLLFIHGLANFKGVWKSNILELSKTHRCIAIDLPGNGHSSSGDYKYSMFFYAECVKQFIDKMNLTNVILVGHSMGGQIALLLSLRYPHLIDKLVLIAASGLEYFSEMDKMMVNQSMQMTQMFYSNEQSLESAIHTSFYNFDKLSINTLIKDAKEFIPIHSSGKWQKMVKHSISAMLNEQVQQFLPTIKLPTLIIFGDNDAMIPNKLLHASETVQTIAKKANALIENSQVLIIKNAGHFVQIEKSKEVNASIEAFVN
jgi:pimeloyl-ACP methyl ester carboxylesterase